MKDIEKIRERIFRMMYDDMSFERIIDALEGFPKRKCIAEYIENATKAIISHRHIIIRKVLWGVIDVIKVWITDNIYFVFDGEVGFYCIDNGKHIYINDTDDKIYWSSIVYIMYWISEIIVKMYVSSEIDFSELSDMRRIIILGK